MRLFTKEKAVFTKEELFLQSLFFVKKSPSFVKSDMLASFLFLQKKALVKKAFPLVKKAFPLVKKALLAQKNSSKNRGITHSAITPRGITRRGICPTGNVPNFTNLKCAHVLTCPTLAGPGPTQPALPITNSKYKYKKTSMSLKRDERNQSLVTSAKEVTDDR